MSWTNLTTDPEDAVRRAVRWRKYLGLKQDHAFADAGAALGLTPRYVRGVVRGEIVEPLARRWHALRERWWRDMDRQAARFREIADQIERQAEAERIADAQFVLPLLLGGDQECAGKSERGLYSTAGGGPLTGRTGRKPGGSIGDMRR